MFILSSHFLHTISEALYDSAMSLLILHATGAPCMCWNLLRNF
ncbi:hypothetical protein HMPREF9374_0553 [Desmospora sp. 8437]|nr:hypothetical protein HMPREF9374_0553 [Desmospora sp. 8437]